MMRKATTRKGQSTVEYVIVFTAIAAAVIFAALSLIKPAVNKTQQQAANTIERGAATFMGEAGLHKLSNTTP